MSDLDGGQRALEALHNFWWQGRLKKIKTKIFSPVTLSSITFKYFVSSNFSSNFRERKKWKQFISFIPRLRSSDWYATVCVSLFLLTNQVEMLLTRLVPRFSSFAYSQVDLRLVKVIVQLRDWLTVDWPKPRKRLPFRLKRKNCE